MDNTTEAFIVGFLIVAAAVWLQVHLEKLRFKRRNFDE